MGSRIIRGFKPETIYDIQVQAENVYGVGEWSAIYQHTTGNFDSLGPDPPASATVTMKGNDFLIKWATVDSRDITGYAVWCNTSNSFSGSKVMKRVRKPTLNAQLGIGTVDLTSGTLTLSYSTPYYFFVTTYSGYDNDSLNYPACVGNPIVVYKAEWLRHYTTPWKMSNRSVSFYRTVTPGVTELHTVSAGKIGLLQVYYLRSDTDGGVVCWAGFTQTSSTGTFYSIEENFTTSAILRSPAITNGFYLGEYKHYGIRLEEAASTGEARMRVLEFDAESDITLVNEMVTSLVSYTVPAGKRLVVTYVLPNSTGATYLQIKQGATWYSAWDIYDSKWDVGKGVLQFPAGVEIGSDGSPVFLYGVTLDDT